ncbi:MAG: hypothetical protein HKN32_03195, partial [Flavobacteriales bacterium]|nr:hypothetical protein [Flavobacteriales bacterium]
GSGVAVAASPDENSTYEVVAVNENGCVSEPENIDVLLYGELQVQVMEDVEICQNDAVSLDAISATGGNGDYSYQWIYDGSIIGQGENYTYVPAESGEFCVLLTASCESPSAQDCVLVEIEEVIDVAIAADTTRGCWPADITLMVSPEIDPADYATAQWTLSDGWFEFNAQEFEHTFENPGLYDVDLTLISSNGCSYSGSFFNYITVYDNPTAGYYADPQPTQAPASEISFYDWSSNNVVAWYW